MRTAVIIATRNRPERLAEALRSVASQLRAGDTLLVVDQSDEPVTQRVAAAAAGAGAERVYTGPTGLPAARNVGVQATSAPLILFLDDDAILCAGALDAHRAAYASDPTLGGAVGWIEDASVRPNARPGTLRLGLDGRVRYNPTGHQVRPVFAVRGCNMSFRRAALNAAGPCDTSLRGNAFLEDAEWAARVRAMGWRLAYLPTARVVHSPEPTGGCRLKDSYEQARWRFRHTGRYLRRHRPLWLASAAPAFAAIAARHAWCSRDLVGGLRLYKELFNGFSEADAASWPVWSHETSAAP